MNGLAQRGGSREGGEAVAPKRLAELLSVLAHPQRIRIVQQLSDAEQNVSALGTELGLSMSAVSQHLALLRAHRLVGDRRVGRRVYYRLAHAGLAAWLAAASDLLGGHHE